MADSSRTKILTLLNVAQSRPKRKTTEDEANAAGEAEEGRDWASLARAAMVDAKENGVVENAVVVEGDGKKENGTKKAKKGKGKLTVDVEAEASDDEATTEPNSLPDAYDYHFGSATALLAPTTIASVSSSRWNPPTSLSTTNPARISLLSTLDAEDSALSQGTTAKLHPAIEQALGEMNNTQKEMWDAVNGYRDWWGCDVPVGVGGKERQDRRKLVSAWLVQHIIRTRNRIIKNNAHIAAHPEPTRDTLDQGFTRPKVLVLLPFRSSALQWINTILSLSPTSLPPRPLARLQTDYGLPEGTVDKLLAKENADRYPEDMKEVLAGNVGDEFVMGVKWTRKEVRLYVELYGSDLIVASPVGLRSLIEKQGNADFLSSMEVCVVDQMDVMEMQNWDHVNFVFSKLNQIPLQSHSTDFSRLKPWYTNAQSHFLRQTILFSSHPSPQTRSLYRTLSNVSGKIRSETPLRFQPGVLSQVREGLKQTWVRFESGNVGEEEADRWKWFKEVGWPGIWGSAVAREGGTMVFVPSYLDFVRVKAYLKELEGVEFAEISEYSTNSEISSARTDFFNRKVPILLTERFHFYRRYTIRGPLTILFYAPPENPLFYPEVCAWPFATGNNVQAVRSVDEVDVEEVKVDVGFCRWDQERVVRICGGKEAKRMCEGEGRRFTFV